MYAARMIVVIAAVLLSACQTSQAPKFTPASPDVLAQLQDVKGTDGQAVLKGMGFVRPSPDDLNNLIDDNTLKTGTTYAYYKWDDRVYIRNTALGLRSRGKWNIQDDNVCIQVGEANAFCTAIFVRETEFLCWPNYGEYPNDTGFARACELFGGNAIPVSQ